MPVYNWSTTPASNATADATINWAEGMAPSAVNDSARAMMAALAKLMGDISGAITTSGSATAYTVASNSGFDTLAHLHNQMIAFVPHATNTGTAGSQTTLNVDGLGAKPIRLAPSVEIPDGTLILGTPYVATYNNTDGAFYLQGIGSTFPYMIPLGGMIPYTGTSAPNSSFVLPYGQAISRTTYATYFTQVSTTFGTGDGSTTFNVPDLRGRVPFGKDNMGGSAASRLSNAATGGIVGTTLGATGGEQAHTLTTAELAAHSHGITDPGHNHPPINGATAVQDGGANDPLGTNAGSQTRRVSTSVPSQATGTNTTGISINNAGSGNSHNSVPPGIVLNYILRVI
jgi:microcystin-dependent protein